MSATLKPSLPGGTIRSQDSESDFQDWVSGRTCTRRLLIIEVEAAGVGGETQEKGRVTKTRYGAIHAVEIRDPHEIDQLRHRITQIRAEGGFLAKQPALFDATDEEKRESLIDMIRDWASENDLPMSDVDARFVDYFGGVENATSESVQACKSVAQLSEFAYAQGVLAETKPDDMPPLADDDSDDGEDDPSGDGDPDDEAAAEPEPARGKAVPFQPPAGDS
jgi:hypothetical protein